MAARTDEIIFSCCGPLQEVPWTLSLVLLDEDLDSVGSFGFRVVLELVSDLTCLLNTAARMVQIICFCRGPLLQEVLWKLSLAASEDDSQSVGISSFRPWNLEAIRVREAG